jgi:hypothetical protein
VWDIYRVHPKANPNIKVHNLHPAVGVGCRTPHRHLSQLKGPCNTFDIKGERTLPFVGNVVWDIYWVHPKANPNIKVDNSHPAMGLGCRNPHRHLSQL